MSEEKSQDESALEEAPKKAASMMDAMKDESSELDLSDRVEEGPVPSIFEQFETDEQAENEGRWFPVGRGMEFKLRRFQSKDSISARIRAEKVVRKRTNNMTGEFTPEQGLQVLKLQLAGGVIADWRGDAMRDDDGPLPFSKDAAFMLLDKFNELTQNISGYCMDVESYRKLTQDETVKN